MTKQLIVFSFSLLSVPFAGTAGFASSITAGHILRASGTTTKTVLRETTADDPIISPFDTTAGDSQEAAATTTATTTEKLEGPLELTWDNVEKVLDEMRPFLIQDGGNVAITEIDGPVVRLELQVSYCSFAM